MSAYYNEFDQYAAQWLRNLIAAGLIAPGDVDNRSIADVRPDDLIGYTQCHFFAGIGCWSHALRLAGWPDDRPVWTGSCPCQPFSLAGKGAGTNDARHLWPVWFNLLRECQPTVVFGEQVAAAIGHDWLDALCADMEGENYACGAAVLGAHSVGAPHIRQRLYFVAHHHHHQGLEGRLGMPERTIELTTRADGLAGKLAYTAGDRQRGQGSRRTSEEGREPRPDDTGQLSPGLEGLGFAGGVAYPGFVGRQRGEEAASGYEHDRAASERQESEYVLGVTDTHRLPGNSAGPTNDHWRDADWLLCRDGKWRPVEPGTFPLAHGVAARVGRLRAYGNAIVPQVAAEFISAYLEAA